MAIRSGVRLNTGLRSFDDDEIRRQVGKPDMREGTHSRQVGRRCLIRMRQRRQSELLHCSSICFQGQDDQRERFGRNPDTGNGYA